jgi:hypothetical protein
VPNKFYITHNTTLAISNQKYYIAPMTKSSQLSFISKTNLNTFKTLKHGGKTSKGKRKTKRPLIKNKSLHLVFKSSRAFGKLNLFRFDSEIKRRLRKYSKTNFFEILDYVNMGNHLVNFGIH